MTETLLSNEATVRIAAFLAVLLALAVVEFCAPRRRAEIPRLLRWSNNLGLLALDTVLVRLTFPILAVGLALVAEDRGWGLFAALEVTGWVAVVFAILALDLAIYLQHVMFHAVPALWRLHRVHHADLEVDVTTGLRFHPLEILMSMAIKLGVVAALGPPAIAVLVFEVLLNVTSMFNHSNIRLSPRLDALLRMVVVTPDMHRVHHSVRRSETDSNFGFNLPWWDFLLGTYLAQPRDGHDGMTLGISQFRTRRDLWLDRMLYQPFLGTARRAVNPAAPEGSEPATGRAEGSGPEAQAGSSGSSSDPRPD